MMEWKLVNIGDSGLFIADGNYSAKYPSSKEFISAGIPFIRANNFKNKAIVDDELYFISSEKHSQITKGHLKANDVLITTRGNIGELAMVPKRHENSNINAQIVLLRCNDKWSPLFLLYALSCSIVREQLPALTTGTALKQLPVKNLKQILIPFPPLPQQQKIANILDAADELRQNDKKLIAKYDELTQALFLDMFGDPVSNPKGWEKVELNKLCSFKKKSIKPEDIKAGQNYVALDSVEKVTGNITTVYNVEKDELKSNKFWFDGSYILYGKLRPYLNKVALPDFEGICSTDIIPIQPFNKKSNKLFITSILRHNSFVAFADERSSGANLPRISPSEVEKYATINPPIELQNQFAERVELIEEQKAIAQKSLEKSEDLFNSLLQKAFNGELV